MEELDFEPLRIGAGPQETLLIFGVRSTSTAIVLTKDASYDPIRDAKALLFYLSNGLDPVTFQSFCEMIATLYIHNVAASTPPMMAPIKDSKPSKQPKWVAPKKRPVKTEEVEEDDENSEFD